MSNSSELDQTVKTYLINAINLEGYDFDHEIVDTRERLKALENIFYSEVGNYLVPELGRQKTIENWLRGLPSSLDIAFANYDILQLAIKWESIPYGYTEKQAEKILDNYFNLLAAKLGQLFDGYRVPKI